MMRGGRAARRLLHPRGNCCTLLPCSIDSIRLLALGQRHDPSPHRATTHRNASTAWSMPCRQSMARGRWRIAACATSAFESPPCPPRREAMRSIKWAAHGASTFTPRRGGVMPRCTTRTRGGTRARGVAGFERARCGSLQRCKRADPCRLRLRQESAHGWARGTASRVTRGGL
jgi:hypothetical protein